jgi:hypothetical protein
MYRCPEPQDCLFNAIVRSQTVHISRDSTLSSRLRQTFSAGSVSVGILGVWHLISKLRRQRVKPHLMNMVQIDLPITGAAHRPMLRATIGFRTVPRDQDVRWRKRSLSLYQMAIPAGVSVWYKSQ